MAFVDKKRKYCNDDFILFDDVVSNANNLNTEITMLSEDEKERRTANHIKKYGYYIGKIQENQISGLVNQINEEEFHKMVVDDNVRERIFNQVPLEAKKKNFNADKGRYQIPVTSLKKERTYQQLSTTLAKISSLVQGQIVRELRIDEEVVKKSDNPFNILVTINQALEKKARETTAAEFMDYAADPNQTKVSYQNMHVDLDYNQHYKNKYLSVLPLRSAGTVVRVVEGSHCFENWPDLLRNLVSNDTKPVRTVGIPLKFGEYICFHPKLIHSGWESAYNVRLHSYIGFTDEKITNNTTYYIPRLIYSYL